ncbi:MAG: peptidyl-prolyl cis-trans isomerase [Nitrospirota bacterium]
MVSLIMIAAGAWAAPADPAPAGPPEGSAAKPTQPVTRNTVVAEINGVKISYGELEDSLFERIPNVTGHGTISPERLRDRAFEILELLIRDELLIQEAKRLSITVDQKKVDAEIGRQRGLFPSEEKFQEALTQRGMTERKFRQRIERAILIQDVIDREVVQKVSVSDQDLIDYYRQHPEKFVIPQQYRLRLLLLRVPPEAPPDVWESARQRAVELRTRAKQKADDFAALIQQYSDDLDTRDRGGDTGWVHHGQLGIVDVEHAVEFLRPGDYTEPVRTLYGYYVARVEEKRPGREQTFEEVNKELFRQELLQSKRKERYEEWFTAISSKAKITRLPVPS